MTLIAIALMVSSFGCQTPEAEPSVNDGATQDIYLISKIVTDQITQTFFYDEENRLVRSMLFNKEELIQVEDYTYLDERSREKVITLFSDGEQYSGSGIETFNELNQPNNRIGISLNVRNGVGDVKVEDDQFTYDENGFISRMECFTGGQLGISVAYEVDESGNIIRKTMKGIAFPLDQESTYKYDDQKHYSHHADLGLSDEPMQHNITRVATMKDDFVDPSGSYTSVYDYNESGLPIQETRTHSDGRKSTVRYEYK